MCASTDRAVAREYDRTYRSKLMLDKDRYLEACDRRNETARRRYAQRKKAEETCARLCYAFETYAGGDPFDFLVSLTGREIARGDWKALFDALAQEVRV